MVKKISCLLSLVFLCDVCVTAQLTLDYCIGQAEANYPLLRKYDIVEQSMSLELSDINKSWLPAIGISAQGTVQNAVPQFPDALRGVLDQMGQKIRGLDKIQYKIGADVVQTIWDGGRSKNQREIIRLRTQAEAADVSVRLYAIHERVMSLYFGILLLENQILQTEETVGLLEMNRNKLMSMMENGTAMQSDADMVSVQILSLKQKITEATSAVKGYREALGLFMDEDITDKTLTRPEMKFPDSFVPDRPELRLFDIREDLNHVMRRNITASLMPQIGFFAQAYYGYPGFDYFRSMMKKDLSFNILAGIKVTWNFSSLYSVDNSRKKLELQSWATDVDKDIFLFNTNLQVKSQRSGIDGLKAIVDQDRDIIRLRIDIRKVAESQLDNGIIDITGLLTKITDENQARLSAGYHEIELLYSIYKLKNILNR